LAMYLRASPVGICSIPVFVRDPAMF
jgi:hypothetical protein